MIQRRLILLCLAFVSLLAGQALAQAPEKPNPAPYVSKITSPQDEAKKIEEIARYSWYLELSLPFLLASLFLARRQKSKDMTVFLLFALYHILSAVWLNRERLEWEHKSLRRDLRSLQLSLESQAD